jgi:hypothetical protein
MNGTSRKSKKTQGILDDHRQFGKKLKSPMASLLQIRSTSYIDDIIPEILHIAMIFRAYGYADGIGILEKFLTALKPYSEASSIPLISKLKIKNEDIGRFIADLEKEGVLEKLKIANGPFRLLESWPLKYLGYAPMEDEVALARLKDCVGSLLDKSKTPACAALAMVIYWQGASGKLHYVNGVKPPDLNAIIDRPGSDDAMMASAQVRAAVMAYWGLGMGEGGIDPDWAKEFWQQSFRLSPCKVAQPADGDD